MGSFVSATTLSKVCPYSLIQTHFTTDPNRSVWTQSYAEEKQRVLDYSIYHIITKEQYIELCRNGAVRAITALCCLTIKNAKMQSYRAKSRIVVFSNLEDRYLQIMNDIPPSLPLNLSVFSLHMSSKSVVSFSKVTVKIPFATSLYPTMKSLSYFLRMVTLILNQGNTGYFEEYFMDCKAAHSIGTTWRQTS